MKQTGDADESSRTIPMEGFVPPPAVPTDGMDRTANRLSLPAPPPPQMPCYDHATASDALDTTQRTVVSNATSLPRPDLAENEFFVKLRDTDTLTEDTLLLNPEVWFDSNHANPEGVHGVHIRPTRPGLAWKHNVPCGVLSAINDRPVRSVSDVNTLLNDPSVVGKHETEVRLRVLPTSEIVGGNTVYSLRLVSPSQRLGIDVKDEIFNQNGCTEIPFPEDKKTPETCRVRLLRSKPKGVAESHGMSSGILLAVDGRRVHSKAALADVLKSLQNEGALLLKFTVDEGSEEAMQFSDNFFFPQNPNNTGNTTNYNTTTTTTTTKDNKGEDEGEEEEEDDGGASSASSDGPWYANDTSAERPTLYTAYVHDNGRASVGFMAAMDMVVNRPYLFLAPPVGSPLARADVPKGAFIYSISGLKIGSLHEIQEAVLQARNTKTNPFPVIYYVPSTLQPLYRGYDSYDDFLPEKEGSEATEKQEGKPRRWEDQDRPQAPPPYDKYDCQNGVLTRPEEDGGGVVRFSAPPPASPHQNPEHFALGYQSLPRLKPEVAGTLYIPPTKSPPSFANPPSDHPFQSHRPNPLEENFEFPGPPQYFAREVSTPPQPQKIEKREKDGEEAEQEEEEDNNIVHNSLWEPKVGMWVATRHQGLSVRYVEAQDARAGIKGKILKVMVQHKDSVDTTFVQLSFAGNKGVATWRWEDCVCVKHHTAAATILVPQACAKCDKTVWPGSATNCVICSGKFHDRCAQKLVKKGRAVEQGGMQSQAAPSELLL